MLICRIVCKLIYYHPLNYIGQMPYYYYRLKKQSKRPREDEREIIYAESIDDVVPKVLDQLLRQIRAERLSRLRDQNKYLKGQNCFDPRFLINCRKHLPSQYIQYCNNISELNSSMASMYEISKVYTIYDIELAPKCIGCRYNWMGQRDHMQCPDGCLHDHKYCGECASIYPD